MPIDYGHTADDLAREQEQLRWTCPVCLVDTDEPWCDCCGASLSLALTEPHSVRVRDTANAAEVRRLVDTYGVQNAAAVVPLRLIEELLGSRR